MLYPIRVIINNSLNRKLTALIRLSRCQSFDKCRTLMKALIESQFAYVPLTWMFHDRRENHKMNSLHERALRIVYKDDISSFDELLTKDKSFRIHHRNIQSLAIELYKAKHEISPLTLSTRMPHICGHGISERHIYVVYDYRLNVPLYRLNTPDLHLIDAIFEFHGEFLYI